MYFHFISFLHSEITQVVEILPYVTQEASYSTVNIMAADALAT